MLLGQQMTLELQHAGVLPPGNGARSPAKRRCSTPRRRPSPATSTRGRCRSMPDQRPQLDGPDDVVGRLALERVERGAAGPPGLLPDQRRRPVGHADGLLRAEPAALQPRLDRRVPADDQPLRRHAGPHDGHDGQRHHEVGHEHLRRHRSAATSATTRGTRRTSSRRRCCRTRTSRSAARSAGRSSRTGSTSSATGSTSATRRRSRSAAPAARSRARGSTINLNMDAKYQLKQGGAKVDVQFNPKNRLTGRWSHYKNLQPVTGGGATTHPSTASANNRLRRSVLRDLHAGAEQQHVNEIKGGLDVELLHARADRRLGHGAGSRRPPDTAQILVGVYQRPRDRGRRAVASCSRATRLARRPTTRSAPVSTTTRFATTSRPPSRWAGGTT